MLLFVFEASHSPLTLVFGRVTLRLYNFLFMAEKRIMIFRKIYLNRYKTMDILSLGWLGVLGMFTLSIAFVVWGRNGL